tara:strand:- start:3493 stop:4128 length:636 start_codon:yes stop_codon:yes gene_type:complete
MQVHLGFMPGSGGNFLARCLNLHDHIDWLKACVGQDREHKWPLLCYDEVAERVPGRKGLLWRDWEHKHSRIKEPGKNATIVLHHGNAHDEHFDILISTETQDEWRWSLHQALWKDTVFHRIGFLITGLKSHCADVVVPCHHLWNFDLLSESLGHIEQHLGVEQHNQDLRQWQKRLWEQWITTHASDGIHKLLDKVMQGPTKRLPEDKRYAL